MELDDLLADIRGCRACVGKIPNEPRPVLQVSATARLLVASQAPGSRVDRSGIPFADRSGDRLRAWMGVSPELFYDDRLIAILPMGLCYPGRTSGGDAPPRAECAPLWRARLLAQMPELRLTLLVGTYAQIATLGPGRMVDRVAGFEHYLPRYFPLPHPSWRSQIWMREHPWFEAQVLPRLRAHVQAAIADEALP